MPRITTISIASGVALVLFVAIRTGVAEDIPHTAPTAPASQTFALSDTKDLQIAPGVKAEAVEYRGRKAVRLTKDAVDEPALAYIRGTQFRDGTIEVDIATKVITPPGVRMPGFTGIAFRVRCHKTSPVALEARKNISRYVRQDPRFLRPAEVDLLVGDAGKAHAKLGWHPQVAFPELVKLMVDHDLKVERAKHERG